MKALVLCNKGIEDISALEIKELTNKKAECFNGYLTFEFEKKEEICELIYLGQSIKKVGVVLDSISFESTNQILEKVNKLNLKEWLSSEKSFKANVIVEQSEIRAEELKGKVGEAIINGIKNYKQKVDLENPDVILFVYINNNRAFFCIDFSGKDLSKREYRIFSHPRGVKSTIAYAMVRFSGFEKKELLVDSFCLSGAIPIEAALYENNYPINYYKKDFAFSKFFDFNYDIIDSKMTNNKGNIYALDGMFKNIDAAKKNAKIAGIHKSINFSRLEINWLDTKFDENTVDKIVCCPPNISKFSLEKDIRKIYKEFFYHSEFILKKQGKIVLCVLNDSVIIEEAKKQKFEVIEKREVWQGEEKLFLIKFSK